LKCKLRPHHTCETPPTWLQRGLTMVEQGQVLNKHYVRSIRYFWKVLQATGSWTDHSRIDSIYEECSRRRARGENVVVNHIVPICSDIVCGLQTSRNMQIITENMNAVKGNRWWPDCPDDINGVPEQLDLLQATDPVVGQLGWAI